MYIKLSLYILKHFQWKASTYVFVSGYILFAIDLHIKGFSKTLISSPYSTPTWEYMGKHKLSHWRRVDCHIKSIKWFGTFLKTAELVIWDRFPEPCIVPSALQSNIVSILAPEIPKLLLKARYLKLFFIQI